MLRNKPTSITWMQSLLQLQLHLQLRLLLQRCRWQQHLHHCDAHLCCSWHSCCRWLSQSQWRWHSVWHSALRKLSASNIHLPQACLLWHWAWQRHSCCCLGEHSIHHRHNQAVSQSQNHAQTSHRALRINCLNCLQRSRDNQDNLCRLWLWLWMWMSRRRW